MKRNPVILFSVLAVIVSGFLLLERDAPEAAPTETSAVSIASSTVGTPPASVALVGNKASPQEIAAAKAKASGEEAFHRYVAKYNRVINFYGVVLEEQNQTPVPGAEVRLSAVDNPSMSGKDPEPVIVQSDAQGRFSFSGRKGAYLYVVVSKKGYYRVPKRSEAFYTHDEDNPQMNWRILPSDPATPARLYLRQQGTPARLIYLEGTSFDSVIIGKTGQPVFLSLRNGRPTSIEQADIKMECRVDDEGASGNEQYSWTCLISVPGGGLRSRQGEFDFTAPEDGYQEADAITMAKLLPRQEWSYGAKRNYFVHTGSGCFALISVRLDTRNHGSCTIESYFNPNPGERNLEYDSALAVKTR